jgi:hypothetical protein
MKSTKVIAAFLVLIVAIISIVFIATRSKPQTIFPNPEPQPVACTEEAKQCPDGSYVGRTGPQCQFAACPPTGSTILPPPKPSTSGIAGIVLLGPTCPVMRNPPDPQCADKPYQTTLAVKTADGIKTISTFASDTAGKFKVSLPSGAYMITSASSNFYPRCSSNGSVVVGATGYTATTISCDTGIR